MLLLAHDAQEKAQADPAGHFAGFRFSSGTVFLRSEGLE
jgi:hypothetical protein